jgi:hypothetical protein
MAGILPATLNHEALDLGIVSESNQRAAGISPWRALFANCLIIALSLRSDDCGAVACLDSRGEGTFPVFDGNIRTPNIRWWKLWGDRKKPVNSW